METDTVKPSEWLCLYCNQALSLEWARKGQKFCTDSCRAKFWYWNKYKTFYDFRYKRFKREWEQSETGKKAGTPIRDWIKFPKGFR